MVWYMCFLVRYGLAHRADWRFGVMALQPRKGMFLRIVQTLQNNLIHNTTAQKIGHQFLIFHFRNGFTTRRNQIWLRFNVWFPFIFRFMMKQITHSISHDCKSVEHKASQRRLMLKPKNSTNVMHVAQHCQIFITWKLFENFTEKDIWDISVLVKED